jgi:hypothetical protein
MIGVSNRSQADQRQRPRRNVGWPGNPQIKNSDPLDISKRLIANGKN